MNYTKVSLCATLKNIFHLDCRKCSTISEEITKQEDFFLETSATRYQSSTMVQ